LDKCAFLQYILILKNISNKYAIYFSLGKVHVMIMVVTTVIAVVVVIYLIVFQNVPIVARKVVSTIRATNVRW